MAYYNLNLTKIELQKMSIKELRVFARSIGTVSPTSQSKEQLIDNILLILSGQIQPEYKNFNRGRPAKTTNITKGIGFSYGEIIAKVASGRAEYEVGEVLSATVVADKDGISLSRFKFGGLQEKIELDQALIERFELKENDVVDYVVDNGKIIIKQLNGKPINISQSLVNFGDRNLLLYGKNLIKVASLAQKQQILENISKNKKVVLVSADSLISTNNNIVFVPYKVASDQEVINSFFTGLSFARFISSTGDETVVVADDFLTVFASANNQNLLNDLIERLNSLVESNITFVALSPAISDASLKLLEKYFDYTDK